MRSLVGNIAQLEAGRQVAVLHEDGFEGIKKFLPPPSRRALVLCDPSYELKSDYAKVLDMAADSLKRRSEEHTSELQSPCNLVCRLLLEKKKSTYESTDRASNISTPFLGYSRPSAQLLIYGHLFRSWVCIHRLRPSIYRGLRASRTAETD